MEHGFRTDRTRNVTDRTTGEPVGYANISFNGTGRGMVADGHGIYSIDAGTVTPDHTLSFNCIGYDTCTVRLRDIPQDGTFDAFLAPVPQVIEEVTVVPVKTRLKRLGNNFRSPLMEAVHQDDLTGVEFGTIIKIKKRTWLEKVRINVLSCSYDDLVFRLNIYCGTNGTLREHPSPTHLRLHTANRRPDYRNDKPRRPPHRDR